MSTIDGHVGNSKGGADSFKIVIDHAPALSKPSLPTLEVPIPHYRLGTPRFSTRGTAFLHSSVYTSNSTNEDLTSSALYGPEYDKMFPIPPGMDAHSPATQRHSQTSPQAYSIKITPVGDNTQTLAVTSSPAFHRAKEPIVPNIYDALATHPDDPAIVRYVPGTREITAATPARIIAQITSANFLDYELLSDFFLTVRAYLSTHDLLEYLLARFEWAINRFDDDGRVIRVRAFAALRHWILNYFPYDFVIDRELRVKFCNRLNALFRDVTMKSGHGPSDRKLILDLKKCWNGRCALYWDGPLLDGDSLEHIEIHPGGIAGSRDSQLTHPSQLWSKVSGISSSQLEQTPDPDKSTAALNKWFEGLKQAEAADVKGHQRQSSTVTTRSLPTSPSSEQSIQALSCTLPGLGLKKIGGLPQQVAVAHPVAYPVQASTPARRVCPAARSALANEEPPRPKTGHKRSGSFSDAVRDKRTSLPSINVEKPAPQVEMAYPYQGSIIRGAVIPPGTPYIDHLAPSSPVSEMHEMFSDGEEYSDDDESFSDSSNRVVYSSYTSTPGVKNIFGSIRRALSSKQVGHSSLNIADIEPSLPTMAGSKSSTAFSGASRKKSNPAQRHPDPLRQTARIDLLCADAAEMFQRALMQPSEEDLQKGRIPGIHQNAVERRSPDNLTSHSQPPTRNHSGVTYGSRSIPIFDDTKTDEPVPKLPLEYTERRIEQPVTAVDNQQRQYSPATRSGVSQPSPLARLSNAAAIADRVITAPVSGNRPTSTRIETAGATASKTPNISDAKSSYQDPVAKAVGSNSNASPSRPAPAKTARSKSFRSTHSGSRSLRKYASYQSSINKGESEPLRATMTALSSVPRLSKDSSDRPPGRMLRRRPGGDLRANENVHDLDKVPRRSRSAGSITTYSESLRGSGHTIQRFGRKPLSRSSSQPSQKAPLPSEIPSPIAPKPLSLVRTHSSQPALRPSFEAAVAQFARIPDDDAGDIEATLLKLEGRYRKSPPAATQGSEQLQSRKEENKISGDTDTPVPFAALQSLREQGGQPEITEGVSFPIPPDPQLAPTSKKRLLPPMEGDLDQRSVMTRSLYATSEESYNSTPLLERELNDESGMAQKSGAGSSTVSVPQPLFSRNQSAADGQVLSSPLSPEEEQEHHYFRRGARCRSSIPTTTTDSFLLDEDESLSDLSSELSEDTIEADDDIDYPFGSAAHLNRNENRPPKFAYLLGYPTHPPTPPMTQETAKAITSQAKRSQDSRKPPTPDPSPVSLPIQPSGSKPSIAQSFSISKQNLAAHRHIPFVLAFDSVIIAEQFTIIERDALNEVNWQDLINMRWHHKSPSTLNWVDYLRTQEPTGIELVTARFNLIVKWVLSEIVLTQKVEERALAATKFIHIAKHCRKNHNYATLLQLTIALTSIDCSRLTKTWDLVPAAEKKTLKELDTLVTPIKNFHNLRQEMETANAEEGCIPVIGMRKQLLY